MVAAASASSLQNFGDLAVFMMEERKSHFWELKVIHLMGRRRIIDLSNRPGVLTILQSIVKLAVQIDPDPLILGAREG